MMLPHTLSLATAVSLILSTAAFAKADDIAGLDSGCLDTALEDCEVLSWGYLSLRNGPRIAFQTQAGHSVDAGVGGGIVVYAGQSGEWSLLTSAFDGFDYAPPRLAEGDPILLHIPGFYAGTGAMNADLLFRYDDTADTWHTIDIETWHDNVGDLLPEGHEIWKGVDFSFNDWFYNEYIARTPLWLESDANCCASGGWATVHFEIVDDALVPTRVDYTPPDSQ